MSGAVLTVDWYKIYNKLCNVVILEYLTHLLDTTGDIVIEIQVIFIIVIVNMN